MTDINPRYASYAKAHGKSPEDMLEYDKKAWPGGCMCGFILWMSQQSRLFFMAHPEAFMERGRISNQKAWTTWLETSELCQAV